MSNQKFAAVFKLVKLKTDVNKTSDPSPPSDPPLPPTPNKVEV